MLWVDEVHVGYTFHLAQKTSENYRKENGRECAKAILLGVVVL